MALRVADPIVDSVRASRVSFRRDISSYAASNILRSGMLLAMKKKNRGKPNKKAGLKQTKQRLKMHAIFTFSFFRQEYLAWVLSLTVYAQNW